MKHFQLSKYCHAADNSWTSISDMGKPFNGELLTKAEYLLVENKYIEVLHLFLNIVKPNEFKVLRYEDKRGLEENDDNYFAIDDPLLKIRGGEFLTIDTMLIVFRLCLREVMWLRVETETGCYVTFGYDFYVNLGVNDDIAINKSLFESSGLFLREKDEDPHE